VGVAVAAAAEPVHEHIHGDDLKRIKGVGPKLEKLLKSLGVTSYSQIAAWDDDEIDRVDAQLGTFSGRIRRDDWPTQARFLASGDMAGFEQRFGRL
jgi:predicted flap endonuclease-1-like 5' DNA nuclease